MVNAVVSGSSHTEGGRLKSATPGWVEFVRWAGRLWGIFLVLMWLLFLVGEGRGDLFGIFRAEPVLTTALMFMMGGLLLGCWLELWGGFVILVGIALFGMAEGQVPAWPFLLPGASAAAYLLSWHTRYRRRSRSVACSDFRAPETAPTSAGVASGSHPEREIPEA